MKIFYSKLKDAFYPEEFKKDYDSTGSWPKDAVEVSQEDFKIFSLTAYEEGKKREYNNGVFAWVDIEVDEELLKKTERYWRNSELERSDIELNKVQDADPKSVGSVSDWRNYRKALRSYPESEGFPNKEKRPVSPDVKE